MYCETDGFILRLYISGQSARSQRAIHQVKNICEKYLADKFNLEILDVYQDIEKAREDDILATPTLVKVNPMPRRMIVGEFLNPIQVLRILGVFQEVA